MTTATSSKPHIRRQRRGFLPALWVVQGDGLVGKGKTVTQAWRKWAWDRPRLCCGCRKKPVPFKGAWSWAYVYCSDECMHIETDED